MNKEQFIDNLCKINVKLTEKQLNRLDKYYKMLIMYNKNVNLTTITEEKDVYLKHFYDSITLIKAVDLTKPLKVCDVGCGAGFPGIVLKIAFPTLSITLVDSLEKRIKFLDEVIKELDLKDIKAVHTRIEEFKEYEHFDLVVSRAVAKTRIILELACQLPKVDGLVVLMKANIENELEDAKNTISKLNYRLDNVVNFTLPYEESIRNLVVLTKINHTNNIYPRSYTKIKAKSL